MIETLRIQNFLSFAPGTEAIELGPLNVLVGPNGSGKSNLLEALDLLHSAPRDIGASLRRRGTLSSCLWQGSKDRSYALSQGIGFVDIAVIVREQHLPKRRWRYSLSSGLGLGIGIAIVDERIEAVLPDGTMSEPPFCDRSGSVVSVEGHPMSGEALDPFQSILAQLKDPFVHGEITRLGNLLDSIRFYRRWDFGPWTSARIPQPADLASDHLQEDASNLGHVIKQLQQNVLAKGRFQELLRKFGESLRDVDVRVNGGTLQVVLQEDPFEEAIPATRLSDGTLRWLALLAVLLNPKPPPLVCIEEPEMGLHPDLMHVLADLLREASERMQIVVTTHSDALVDALTEVPETVLVCEKENGQTRMRRLDRAKLAQWLKDYTLGQLWRSGEIGGNRW